MSKLTRAALATLLAGGSLLPTACTDNNKAPPPIESKATLPEYDVNSDAMKAARGTLLDMANTAVHKLADGGRVQDLSAEQKALFRGDEASLKKQFPNLDSQGITELKNEFNTRTRNITGNSEKQVSIFVTDTNVIVAYTADRKTGKYVSNGYDAPAGMSNQQAKTTVTANMPDDFGTARKSQSGGRSQ